MQTASSRNWTWVANSIYFDDKRYTERTLLLGIIVSNFLIVTFLRTKKNANKTEKRLVQSAGAVKYIDCISSEE